MLILPAGLLVAAAFWVTARYIQPAPPDSLVMSTGAADGAYHRFGLRYREILARDGVTLELRTSAGSVENLARLKDDAASVDVGFVQGGLGILSLTPLAEAADETTLYSLANLYHEPVWVFYRLKREPTRLADLAGARIAVGAPGSGVRKVALDLLAAHGIDDKTARLLDLAGGAALDGLERGEIDAVFLIAAPEAPAVKRALAMREARLLDLANAPALSRRFPYLKSVTLAQGVVDLAANVPARDVRMVATQANLVIREDLHPALAYLLLEAAVEVHGTPGLFHQPGEFPTPTATDWPLADESKRYFKSGRPFLQRYLPFWLANFVERMIVLIVPIIAVLVPLFKFLPALFSWRQNTRINRWYGELKFLEHDAKKRHIVGEELARVLDRLDSIEQAASQLPIPLSYSDRVYTLRGHIDYVRAQLTALPPGSPAASASP
ncbi:MAG: TAXI family TRAP transporter solute-binding subunit [Burkholderiales bacterium]|nr:TAXI family TRAP transporter solute-binding subunit [Burkholderiales bacterium]